MFYNLYWHSNEWLCGVFFLVSLKRATVSCWSDGLVPNAFTATLCTRSTSPTVITYTWTPPCGKHSQTLSSGWEEKVRLDLESRLHHATILCGQTNIWHYKWNRVTGWLSGESIGLEIQRSRVRILSGAQEKVWVFQVKKMLTRCRCAQPLGIRTHVYERPCMLNIL